MGWSSVRGGGAGTLPSMNGASGCLVIRGANTPLYSMFS